MQELSTATNMRVTLGAVILALALLFAAAACSDDAGSEGPASSGSEAGQAPSSAAQQPSDGTSVRTWPGWPGPIWC